MHPAASQNKEAAECFIDFMCRPDIARMNMDYIYYSTPIQAVVDGMSEEEAANEVLNPRRTSSTAASSSATCPTTWISTRPSGWKCAWPAKAGGKTAPDAKQIASGALPFHWPCGSMQYACKLRLQPFFS